jgi:protein-disulfide isomerase
MASKLTPQVSHRDHIQGAETASVTLVEYGDYECPYCGAAFPIVKAIQKRLGKRLRYVFRHFPLTNTHPHAASAAEAAEAAAAQGKFWEMYELLLRPSARLDRPALLGYAERLGLDVARFDNEVAGAVYAGKIERDVREGLSNGVNATPKFYVDGRRIDGKFPLEGLADAVRSAVAAAEAAS